MPDCQIFNTEQIESLRHGGKILRACLERMEQLVAPGITTEELDRAAEEFITSHEGATPGFKGYHGFPATLCTSINDGTVHGIPGERRLEEGDIISIDCGVLYDNLNTDACITVPVGDISSEATKLLKVTQKALTAGLKAVKEGAHIGDISSAVQETAESAGFSIIKPLTGHGLGDTLHQFPDIPNFGKKGAGAVLPANTLIAIEPIISISSTGIKESGDGWTISTDDGSLSAHFEHTVLVTEKGYEMIA